MRRDSLDLREAFWSFAEILFFAAVFACAFFIGQAVVTTELEYRECVKAAGNSFIKREKCRYGN